MTLKKITFQYKRHEIFVLLHLRLQMCPNLSNFDDFDKRSLLFLLSVCRDSFLWSLDFMSLNKSQN